MFSQCVWEVLVRGLVVVSDTVLRPIVHLHSAKVRAFTRLFSNSIGRLDDPFHVALWLLRLLHWSLINYSIILLREVHKDSNCKVLCRMQGHIRSRYIVVNSLVVGGDATECCFCFSCCLLLLLYLLLLVILHLLLLLGLVVCCFCGPCRYCWSCCVLFLIAPRPLFFCLHLTSSVVAFLSSKLFSFHCTHSYCI